VAAMLQAGYTRTHLPAAAYPAGGRPARDGTSTAALAYAAVGWRDGGMVAGAFRIDPLTHSDTCHYDDGRSRPGAPPRQARGDNRLVRHLGRCALEYHCFAAKNLFMERWEAPLPTRRRATRAAWAASASNPPTAAPPPRTASTSCPRCGAGGRRRAAPGARARAIVSFARAAKASRSRWPRPWRRR